MNQLCNLIDEPFLQEISHASWFLITGEPLAGKQWCKLINESLLQEISHAIWLLRAPCRKSLMQSDYWEPLAGNQSCKLITGAMSNNLYSKSIMQADCTGDRAFRRKSDVQAESPAGNQSWKLQETFCTKSVVRADYWGPAAGNHSHWIG